MKVYATSFGSGYMQLEGFDLKDCRVTQIGGIRKIKEKAPQWVKPFMVATGFLLNDDSLGVHIKNLAATASVAAVEAVGGVVKKLDGFSDHGCSVVIRIEEEEIIYPNEGGYFSFEMTNEAVFEAVIRTYTSGVYPEWWL